MDLFIYIYITSILLHILLPSDTELKIAQNLVMFSLIFIHAKHTWSHMM